MTVDTGLRGAIGYAHARPLGHPSRSKPCRHRRRPHPLGCAAERLLGVDDGDLKATILFWIVHIIVNFFAVKVLIRQPSVAMAGLLALASTIIALIIVNIVVSDISISGVATYVLATLIIWITTAVADVIGGRMIRDRRIERHS